MGRWLFLLAVLPLLGCFSPHYHNGDLQCDTSATPCPDGYHCAVNHTCWQNGQDPPRPPVHVTAAGGAGVQLSDPSYNMSLSIGQPFGGTARGAASGDHALQFGIIRDSLTQQTP